MKKLFIFTRGIRNARQRRGRTCGTFRNGRLALEMSCSSVSQYMFPVAWCFCSSFFQNSGSLTWQEEHNPIPDNKEPDPKWIDWAVTKLKYKYTTEVSKMPKKKGVISHKTETFYKKSQILHPVTYKPQFDSIQSIIFFHNLHLYESHHVGEERTRNCAIKRQRRMRRTYCIGWGDRTCNTRAETKGRWTTHIARWERNHKPNWERTVRNNC